jgi:hypothetical protein
MASLSSAPVAAVKSPEKHLGILAVPAVRGDELRKGYGLTTSPASSENASL